ncbi:F0F1 ATP synthase subunit B [Thermosediminibacter oceani]|uniref:ATP synthase subunit b n=1 Tax=Thermosediminibacter oceani (strain ATCC BAA-1034 / DSM 16646 / JW/IW-1228P) TaxID=555079 RepID=D9RZW7_THEOJ|nr:F0F1 ATP synthase subunit B [Thermosediminibacter oceani]ADL08744.1 ATP synthase F0, B subunit [Thermosediminibacter oceani DSM 16646]
MLLNPFTVILQLINVAILFYFMNRFFFRPVREFLEKRDESIKRKFDEAEERLKEARQLYENYREKLDRAGEEVRAMVEVAREQARAIKEEAEREAKERSSMLLARAREEIEREKERAISEVKSRVAELSVMLAAKIIEERLNPQEHRYLIRRAIERMGDEKWVQ